MPRSPKKAATKAAPAHPKYEVMVGKAIIDDASRTGSSRPTLIKYIAANWNLAPDHVRVQLKTQLTRMVEKGWLVPNKASYRLSPEARAELKKADKPAPKKRTAAKKPAAKKAGAKKAGAKKPAAKRAGAKKPAAKKAGAKKPAAKRAGAKKPAAKRAGAKKPAAKRAGAKKPAAKKPALKRAGTMAATAKAGKAFVKKANKKAKAASRK